mgnify:CR=1 FL=1|jgi:hypothetical protein
MAKFNAPQYDPRMLNNIFIFFLVGQVALAISVIYYINSNGALFSFNPRDIPTFSLPVMVLSTNFIARKIFQQQFNRISEIEDLQKKMQVIQLAHVIEWIMVEVGTLILLVFAQLEGNHFFSVLAVFNILYFFTLRPKILMLNEEF